MEPELDKRIVGWMVGKDPTRAAMYNLGQQEEAFDAARRWRLPIVALVVHQNAPDSAGDTNG